MDNNHFFLLLRRYEPSSPTDKELHEKVLGILNRIFKTCIGLMFFSIYPVLSHNPLRYDDVVSMSFVSDWQIT